MRRVNLELIRQNEVSQKEEDKYSCVCMCVYICVCGVCVCVCVCVCIHISPAIQETQEMKVWSLGQEDPLE